MGTKNPERLTPDEQTSENIHMITTYFSKLYT
jgi:hypothetical protein